MKNKIFVTVCIVLLTAILTACSTSNSVVPSSLENVPPVSDNIKIKVVNGDSAYDPKTLEELVKLSGYVVKGHLLDDAKQKLYSPEPGVVIYGVTVSSLEITQVYKGDINKGDKIPIAEKYYTLEHNGDTTRYELGYAPSQTDKEYIFFLNKADDKNEFMRGFYSPMVKETGRYPVISPKDSNYSSNGFMSINELNLVQTEPDTYKKIYQQVIEKYMK